MVCGQTMEPAGQILELHKSHGVDEETTYKQDSSLQEGKTKKGGEWLPLIEARAFYMLSVMLTWFLTSRCFRHYRKKFQGLSFRFPSRSEEPGRFISCSRPWISLCFRTVSQALMQTNADKKNRIKKLRGRDRFVFIELQNSAAVAIYQNNISNL